MLVGTGDCTYEASLPSKRIELQHIWRPGIENKWRGNFTNYLYLVIFYLTSKFILK